MNREEVNNLFKSLSKENKKLLQELHEMKLNNEIKELQEKYTQVLEVAQNRFDRIQKAIEYINNNKEHEYRNGNDNEFYLELNEKEMNNLLDILKGGNE